MVEGPRVPEFHHQHKIGVLRENEINVSGDPDN